MNKNAVQGRFCASKYNTQNCHAELVSASTPLIIIGNKEEILNRVQDDIVMKKALNKNAFRAPLRSAFTLIELLVVVLIIGILAAVAVPQYQKAVDKARFAEVMPLVKNVKAMQEVYSLNYGNYAANCEDLGVDLPSGTFFNTSHFIEDNKGNFIVRCSSTKATGILLNSSRQNAIAYAQYYDKVEEGAGKITCWARNESRYKQFCRSVCNSELEEQFNAQGKNNGFTCEL